MELDLAAGKLLSINSFLCILKIPDRFFFVFYKLGKKIYARMNLFEITYLNVIPNNTTCRI